MNFDSLSDSWREQNDTSGQLDSTELLAKVIRRAERGRVTNLIWAIVGCVASLEVLRSFSSMVLHDPSSLVRIGAALCVLGAFGCLAGCVFCLWPSRIGDQSVCDYFSRELKRTNKILASTRSPYCVFLLFLVVVGVCVIAVVNLPTARAVTTIALALAACTVALWGGRQSVSRAEILKQDIEQMLSDLRQDPAELSIESE